MNDEIQVRGFEGTQRMHFDACLNVLPSHVLKTPSTYRKKERKKSSNPVLHAKQF
jgi:hypothetical protein